MTLYKYECDCCGFKRGLYFKQGMEPDSIKCGRCGLDAYMRGEICADSGPLQMPSLDSAYTAYMKEPTN